MDSTWQLVFQSLPSIIQAGVKYTIPLSLISFVLGLILAVVTALIRLSQPVEAPGIGGKIASFFQYLVKWIFRFYVWIFRSTPLLVQLFIIFYGLPKAGIQFDPWSAAILTFSLNTGAYASETIRASISAIPQAQWEAAYALGMKRSMVLWRVILPQAARISLPPLSNSFIGLVKDTSLASTITIVEMFQIGQQIAARTYEPLILYSTVAFVYLIICTVLTWLQGWLEKRTSRYVQTNNTL